MKYDAFIFARGGSKGVPGKNIKKLGDKPLIAWSIDCALQSQYINRVIVSTDSQEICDTALAYGAEVPFMRPNHLAEDTSLEWDAWRHALVEIERLEGKMPDVLLSLPATAPLRSVEDVEKCIHLFEESGADIVFTVKSSSQNPWFNMVTVNKLDEPQIVVKPKNPIARRQDAPKTFDITTVCYIAKSSYVMSSIGLFAGNSKVVEVPEERAVDIDTPLEFQFAELLLSQKTKEKE